MKLLVNIEQIVALSSYLHTKCKSTNRLDLYVFNIREDHDSSVVRKQWRMNIIPVRLPTAAVESLTDWQTVLDTSFVDSLLMLMHRPM
jgi:hypothetical protein